MRHVPNLLLAVCLTLGLAWPLRLPAESAPKTTAKPATKPAAKTPPAAGDAGAGATATGEKPRQPLPDSQIKLMIYRLYYPSKRMRRQYSGYRARHKGQEVVIHHGWDTYYYDVAGSPKVRITRFEHGRSNGPMKGWSQDGVLLEEGTYADGKKHGEFKLYYANGKLKATFLFVEGEKSGESVIYDGEGKVRARIPYRDGKKNGEAVNFTEDGKVLSKVTWRNDKKHGPEIVNLPGGRKDSQLNWKNGDLDGQEIYWDPETQQIMFQFGWKNGVKHGEWRENFPNGEPRMLLTYLDGKIHGPFGVWNERHERMSEGEYRSDQPWSGIFRLYGDLPGTVFTYTYRDGKLLDGVLLADGKPLTGEYVEWYVPGHIRRRAMYKDGRLDGRELMYNYAGKQLSDAKWTQNVLNGLYTQWYDGGELQGQKMREIGVANGRKDGPETVWSERGIPVAHGINRDGKPWKGYLPSVIPSAKGEEPTILIQNYNDGLPVAMNFKHPDLQRPETLEAIDRGAFGPIDRKVTYIPPTFKRPGGGSGVNSGIAEPEPDIWVDDPVPPESTEAGGGRHAPTAPLPPTTIPIPK